MTMLPIVQTDVQPLSESSLTGRVVLITGALGGLGRATALACAKAGATVVLAGRKVRPLEALYDELEALGAARPAIYPIDLEGASPDDYANMAEAIRLQCGHLDGIVHAAVLFDGLRPLDQFKPNDWMRIQHVAVNAPFLLTQACLPLLRQRDDAAVVFVAEDPQRIGKAFWGSYGVAKAALAAFASILHEETENGSVRTHALLPPPMRTALRRMAYFGEDTLVRETPDRAAEALVWLLGPDAVALRGRTLDIRSTD
ncbi:MAG TPA: SDR family NAD(P)-dependent oxidoreductase [Dokdonella sp.]|uniref:SDR family NAD(P)-dependent oxidoreductase n=1 Tax=Dokdonella sp. TaxID=2291710 RepID=UPI002D7FFCB2|nr:SDR family NAD(P)-dependent oxidoreductase [Dokdonella sp.]HET9031862.1 SDR family NAD(P)-dependent oxidoreductase [Dokdonella sp.]